MVISPFSVTVEPAHPWKLAEWNDNLQHASLTLCRSCQQHLWPSSAYHPIQKLSCYYGGCLFLIQSFLRSVHIEWFQNIWRITSCIWRGIPPQSSHCRDISRNVKPRSWLTSNKCEVHMFGSSINKTSTWVIFIKNTQLQLHWAALRVYTKSE